MVDVLKLLCRQSVISAIFKKFQEQSFKAIPSLTLMTVFRLLARSIARSLSFSPFLTPSIDGIGCYGDKNKGDTKFLLKERIWKWHLTDVLIYSREFLLLLVLSMVTIHQNKPRALLWFVFKYVRASNKRLNTFWLSTVWWCYKESLKREHG